MIIDHMTRKELHQEIEQLIQSIKLHYNQISHEVRIPGIELELITSKIRRLHEKSIIYNHLHTLEEQGLILTPSAPFRRMDEEEDEAESAQPAPVAQVVQNPEPPAPAPAVTEAVPNPSPVVTEVHQEATNVSSGRPDLQGFISINDKYMFISGLFWGNADEYRKAIAELNQCASRQDAGEKLIEFSVRFKWEADSEVRKALERCVTNRYL